LVAAEPSWSISHRRHPYRAARRESTERPITAELGANRIVGTNPKNIIAAFNEAMSAQARQPEIPPLWDGQAAKRIVKVLAEKLSQ
jgi:UDP-N-acetylglucosamine 2-epimerase (non-hydrolysing)